jgi:hypothetical protein
MNLVIIKPSSVHQITSSKQQSKVALRETPTAPASTIIKEELIDIALQRSLDQM